MKKLVLVMIAVFAFTFANAQEVSFGVKAGVNYAGTLTSDSDYNAQFNPVIGPNFAVVAEIRLSDVFSVQPEIMFSPSGFNADDDAEGYQGVDFDVNGKVNYLNIPIMAKYYATEALSIEAGPYFGFVLSAKLDGDVKVGDFVVASYDNEDVKDDYESLDVGFGGGASYELENGLFFTARYNVGLMNIEAETEEMEEKGGEVGSDDFTIKNNIFQFSVGYKFM